MKSKFEKRLSKIDAFSPNQNLESKILQNAENVVPNHVKSASLQKFSKFSAVFVSISLIFVILASSIITGLSFQSYKQFYVDINPSIKISTNIFDVVNSVEYLNEDAESTFGTISLKRKSIDEALEIILQTLSENGYFENAELYLSAYSKFVNTEKYLNDIVSCAEKIKAKNNYSFVVDRGNISRSDVEDSKAENISPMKYKLIKQIIEKDSSYTFENLKDKTMKELKNLLESLK